MERQKELDLTGKVAIVTGASRGIGKHTALKLAERGVHVAVAARTVDPHSTLPGTIGETAAQIEALGVGALAVQTDLAVEEDLRRLVERTTERFGGVDLLINNAAVTQLDSWAAPFLEIPREDFLYQFAVNVHSVFTLAQLVVPIMEARGGGRIVNVSTGSGEAFRQPEEPPMLEANGEFSLMAPGYFASKRAMDRLGNVIAPQLARKGVYLTTVYPGLVASEIAAQRVESEGLDDSVMVPMDVPARLLVYFCACEHPEEYMGRIFWAERELEALGIEA